MKKIAALVLLLSTFFIGASPKQDITVSIVVKRLSSCDYFLLYNNRGYVLAEHYSGHEFDEGDKVYGNINAYSFKDVYDSELQTKEHIYIEDWGLSKSDAVDKLLEKCK